MAGTNDIAGNTGPISPAQTHDNLAMMAMLARASGIGVLLGSIPPADGFPWRPGLATVEPIRAINAWAKDYAARHGAAFVHYTPALATPAGAMRRGFADDGVHPTPAGYAAMEAVLTPVLRAKGLPAWQSLDHERHPSEGWGLHRLLLRVITGRPQPALG